MRYLPQLILLVLLFILFSCQVKEKKEEKIIEEIKINKTLSKAEIIINKTIEAHGGNLYNTASYSFVFRNKEYSFTNNYKKYKYTVKRTIEGKEVLDVLENGKLSRQHNKELIKLNVRETTRYTGSLNSVIYFATLPYKLNDSAVNKEYQGLITIKGKEYDVIEITFNKEGGGEDHDDEYFYWINSETGRVDYLAYNYQVNSGGVRFRSAYNTRNVNGILFQDYINYKAPLQTALKDLPALYEKGELKEVSKIITEDVNNLKRKIK